MTEDKLEGTGLSAHDLVYLDVFRVLALPLYLHVAPWGRNLEKEPPQSQFGMQGKSPSRTPGLDARVPGVWVQTPGPWRLALESEKDSCLSGETDFVEAFTPSFDPKAQHINRGAGLAPKTLQETPSRVPATPSPLVYPSS